AMNLALAELEDRPGAAVAAGNAGAVEEFSVQDERADRVDGVGAWTAKGLHDEKRVVRCERKHRSAQRRPAVARDAVQPAVRPDRERTEGRAGFVAVHAEGADDPEAAAVPAQLE